MIWFILAAVVAILIGVSEHRKYGGIAESLFAGAVALFIGGMVAGLVALIVGEVYEPVEHTYSFDVKAAKDGSSIQGQFSIFGGYIDEEAYYFFYREYGDGRIEQGRIRADDTVIYEDQENRSYIQVTHTHRELELFGFTPMNEKTYEIHVPSGSVKQEVEFDLE